MKALTVRAPWAHLIAIGKKRLEIRSQPTNYRGPLVICAGLKESGEPRFCTPEELEAARNAPRGVALCIVDVVDCTRVAELQLVERNYACCDVLPDQWAWELANPRCLTSPPKVRGQQGFFWVDLDVDAA